MKGFKLTENGDISITDGQIDMISGTELETQTIKTLLGTNKGESPFNADEGIDHKQMLSKGVTEDMIKTQIQSGIFQVNPERVIDEFEYAVKDRHAVIDFTARKPNGSSIFTSIDIS